MKIVKVETQGFRGKSEVYKLTGKDIFLGENGVGKTKVQNAITYCLTGRLGESKKNEAIFSEYASEQLMHVSILFEDQIQITRRLIEKSKKNVVSYETNCYVDYVDTGRVLCTGVKAVNSWIEENLNVPEIILMFNKFDSMKTTARRELLKEYVPYEEPTIAEIVQYLRRCESFEDCEEGYEEEFSKALGKLAETKSLKEMIEMAERQRAYNLEIKNNDKGAKVTLANIKNQMSANIHNKPELQEELTQIRLDIDLLLKEIGKTNGLLMTIEERRKQVLDFEFILKTEFVDNHESIEAMLNEAIESHNKLLEKSPKSNTRKDDIHAILSDIEIRLNECVDREQELSEDRARDFDKLEQVEERIDICSIDQLCPITGLECSGDMIKVVDELLDERGRIKARLDESQEAVDLAISNREKVEQKKQIMVKALIEEDDRELLELEEYNSKIGPEIDRLEATIEKLENRLNANREAKDFHERNVEYAKTGLHRISENPVPEHQPLEKLERRLAVARNRRKAIVDELDQMAEKATAYELQMQTALMCEMSSITTEVWTHIKKHLGVSGLQGELIKQSVGPFTKLMDITLNKFNRHEHFFIETVNEQGAEVLRFGWIRHGQKINYASLSNGERLINAICMMYVFQKIKKIEFKIIMLDDVEKLDTDNAMAIQTGINALDIDNAILCGRRIGNTIDQYNVVVMTC